ncbi:MAG: type ISP restriction/modification enzyme, partial [Thermosynechococcaceae cyanobacterium]
YMHVPMIQALFSKVGTPMNLGRLDLVEVLDWAGDALNRVDRESFFSKFDEGEAVQYFYEPFLQAFDPKLRKELGVWYTPPEIVKYMVARVDTVLREELDIADGLADPNVYILDPCCGTGAYLVEVLRKIDETLKANGGDALGGSDLKKAAMERVFGFEILTAPFVVAHLQLGLLLQNLGVPLVDDQERVSVYLTNALTGWEPPEEEKEVFMFPELEEEKDAAERVKRDKPILVILGNPPYNGFAGVAIGEERDLSNAYRTTVNVAKPEGQGLNELYTRFFRMAERRIVEQTGEGVICFISNYSWLDGLSFTGMRERYLEAFDSIWIDNLHGDRIISEYSPDGKTSETVFAVQGSSVGIKIGTAIGLFTTQKSRQQSDQAKIQYRDMHQARAAARRDALLETLTHSNISKLYEAVTPPLILGLPFKPLHFDKKYSSYPLLPAIFPTSFPGVQTKVDELVIDIDKDSLLQRMEQYFDPQVSHQSMEKICSGAINRASQFKPIAIREYLVKRGFLPEYLVRYSYRPFDHRWIYWEPETNLLGRKSPDYFPQVFENNLWIEAQGYFILNKEVRVLSPKPEWRCA